jgi:hypothetical protein
LVKYSSLWIAIKKASDANATAGYMPKL